MVQASAEPIKSVNPGYMKGCGYNADPGVGETTADVNAELVPLDDSEK